MVDDGRVWFSFKCRKSILDRLRQAAKKHGLSTSQHLVWTLDRHLPPLGETEDQASKISDEAARRERRIEDEAWRIAENEPELAAAIARLVKSPARKLSGLTTQQAKLLEFIREYAAAHDDRTPTYQEMMSGIGIASTSGINRLVLGLEERGYISRTPRQSQSIRLLQV